LVYGAGVNLAPNGYGTANLSNGGETIVLATAAGAAIQTIVYDDVAPWPTAADGAGSSLEIINPVGGADAANWRPSVAHGGSPGWDGAAGLPGDYNADGVVEGADFLTWQRTLGSNTPALVGADGSNNRLVDGADLAIWANNFGQQQAVTAAALGYFHEDAAEAFTADESSAAADDDSPRARSGDPSDWFLPIDTAIQSLSAGSRATRPREEYRPLLRAAAMLQQSETATSSLGSSSAPQRLNVADHSHDALDAALADLIDEVFSNAAPEDRDVLRTAVSTFVS
jgi:hypothetical protein